MAKKENFQEYVTRTQNEIAGIESKIEAEELKKLQLEHKMKQDLLLVLFKVSDFWMPIYRYMSIILVILFPIISILAIFDTIGNITARKDEADLQEAFEKNELRNGCPILINKKRIKGSDVIMREFYTEIPEKIWDKRKNEIADSMNIHYVKKDKPFSHGKKANGRRIVMYSGVGREDPERGEIYDEQF